MRLFKRRCSDPSPQLVSLCPIEEPRVITTSDVTAGGGHGEGEGDEVTSSYDSPYGRGGGGGAMGGVCPASEPASRDQSAERSSPKPQRKGITTWSKKVSRKWDAMKRSDSSELLINSAYHNSRRQYSVNNGQSQSSLPLVSSQSYPSNTNTNTNKRISRVESIRNLFVRSNKDKNTNSQATTSSDMQELKKRFDDIVNRVSNNTNTVLRRTPSGNRRRHTSITANDEYELNEKQLLEYLLMCQPEGCNRSLDELIKNFKETVKNTPQATPAHLGLSKLRLSVLQEENYKKNLRHSAPVDASKFDVLKLNEGPLTIDQLCAVLNSILTKSDESGYDSDSTRNGSDSPRGSIKSQNSETVLLYSSQQDVNSSPQKIIDWQTSSPASAMNVDGLLESMCVDTSSQDYSLNDSEISRNLLEGFNTSIRTLTNVTVGSQQVDVLGSSSKIQEDGFVYEDEDEVDGKPEPEIYVGDTEIEDNGGESTSSASDGGEDCRTLTRSMPRNSFNLSRTSRRKQQRQKSTNSNDTNITNRSSFISNNITSNNTTNVFEENLDRLPSFTKLEPEFVTLGMLNKTSTGLLPTAESIGHVADGEEFFQNCSKLSSSFEKLTQTFNRQLDDMALGVSSGGEDRSPEHTTIENPTPTTTKICAVRPGVVDELVSGFENRSRFGSGSGSGSGVTTERDFKCIRLKTGALTAGLIVERDQTRPNCVAVAAVEKGSPAYLNGNFRIGDEIVKVNGRRLRGLALREAKEVLKSTGDLEIIISRPLNQIEEYNSTNTINRHSSATLNENSTLYYTARTHNGENTYSCIDDEEKTAYLTTNDNMYSTLKAENTGKSKIQENTVYYTPGKIDTTITDTTPRLNNIETSVYYTPKINENRLPKTNTDISQTSSTLNRLTQSNRAKNIQSTNTLNRFSKLNTGCSNTLSRTTKTAAGTFKTIKLTDGTTRTTQNFQSFPKSKSFVGPDQNWTLTQRIEPKIGLYTPKALSLRARSFIDGDGIVKDRDWLQGTSNEGGKIEIGCSSNAMVCDKQEVSINKGDCVDNGASSVTWIHKSPNEDSPFTRKISQQQSFHDLSRLDEESKVSNNSSNEEISFRTPSFSSSWRRSDSGQEKNNTQISVKSQKRYSMQDLGDVNARLQELSPVNSTNESDKENEEALLKSWKIKQELQLTEALRAGKPIIPESGTLKKNPDAPKIVGGTLKPNINPDDVEMKNKQQIDDKLNIDRSFEIESPVKKFAASPAKLGINGSIGRRSSPAKLTGMKKFYYGQKRRSLQATIKETSNSPTSKSTTNLEMSSDRPQAEPISSTASSRITDSARSSINSARRSLQATPCTTSTTPSQSSVQPSSPSQPPTVLSSRPAEILRVQFTKGPGRPSLGFTIAGGRDSPRGEMGLYVKTVLPGGQAEIQGTLKTGDEILSVNSRPLSGMTRAEATAVFGSVRAGAVTLRLLRRATEGGTAPAPASKDNHPPASSPAGKQTGCPRNRKSKSCDDLDKRDDI